jgi:hypothetical protein
MLKHVVEMFASRSAAGGLLGGPVAWRLIFQPAMACFLAIRAGLKDAREGRPPFGRAVCTDVGNRSQLLRSGCRHVGRVFILAIVIEMIYEIRVLGGFYPGQLLLVATVLAVLPYLMIRGPVNHAVVLWRARRKSETPAGRTGPIDPERKPIEWPARSK